MKALIISADHFEDLELFVPMYRLMEAAVEVDVASHKRAGIIGKHGYEVEATLAAGEVDDAAYDLLIIPGGKAPATLREDPQVVALVRNLFERGIPVAAICHGPQVLISANLISGRAATCYHSVAEELQKAGGHYQDRDVVVDGKLITSRHPGDLPVFMREIMGRLAP